MLVRRASTFFLTSALCLLTWAASVEAVTVDNLQAVHRQGQTFLTFTEVAGAGLSYKVYRSPQPITSLNGLTPVATLDQNSGKYLYTNEGFVICDLCAPLSDSTGLLVWTPATNGASYYAVTVTGDPTFQAVGPVAETHQEVPGVVLTEDWTQPQGLGPDYYRHYFAWQPYETWEHDRWGYYGHPFIVTRSGSATPTVPGVKYPLTLNLHSAGGNGYVAPAGYLNNDSGWARGFYISPRDEQFVFVDDPYSPVNPTYRPQTYWTGYSNAAGTLFYPVTEIRVVNYMRAIAATPEYQIDSNRFYIRGYSMGGMGMHIAYHYPQLFAGAEESVSLPSYRVAGHADHCAQPVPPGNIPVGSLSGPLRHTEYYDLAETVKQFIDLPPLLHTWGTEDDSKEPCADMLAILATEAAKQAYIAWWQVQGHVATVIPNYAGASYYFRFRKNEAYPAFSSVSTNSDIATTSAGPIGNPNHAEGQHNMNLDWSSSLHSLGPNTDILDQPQHFEMTIKSLTVQATGNFTLRNAQAFRPVAGTVITWSSVDPILNQVLASGQVVADSHGRVTVPLIFRTQNTRVILTHDGSTQPPPVACDLNFSGGTDVSDIQLCVNQAIGNTVCGAADINHDSQCNVVDVQRVVNNALGGPCVAP